MTLSAKKPNKPYPPSISKAEVPRMCLALYAFRPEQPAKWKACNFLITTLLWMLSYCGFQCQLVSTALFAKYFLRPVSSLTYYLVPSTLTCWPFFNCCRLSYIWPYYIGGSWHVGWSTVLRSSGIWPWDVLQKVERAQGYRPTSCSPCGPRPSRITHCPEIWPGFVEKNCHLRCTTESM